MKKRYTLLLSLVLWICRPAAAQNVPALNQAAPAGNVTPIQQPDEPYQYDSLSYISTFVPFIPFSDASALDNAPVGEVAKSTDFRDGFNGSYQSVSFHSTKEGGQLKDIIGVSNDIPQRDQYSFLPFSRNAYTGNGTGIAATGFVDQKAYYAGKYPDEGYTSYSVKKYYSDDNSRIIRRYSPGKSQIGQSRAVTQQKVSNDAWTGNQSIDAPVVKIWELDANGLPVSPGYYPANVLTGELDYDSTGAQVLSFKDKSGKLVYKRVLLKAETAGQAVANIYGTTYYVYDELGHLRYILPPKATDVSGSSVSTSVLDNLCFQYRYDSKGRLSAQQQPGEQGFTVVVYDCKQRPVMRQTPKEAADHVWEITFYDGQGRGIAASVYNSSDSRDTWQNLFDNYNGASYASNDIRYYLLEHEGEGLYPPESAVTGNVMMSYSYYDNYDTLDPVSFVFNACQNALSFSETVSTPGAETPSRSLRTNGLPTGGKVRILPAPGQDTAKTGDWRWTYIWYDDKGRVTYSAVMDMYHDNEVHHNLIANQYDFAGRLLVSKHVMGCQNSADGNITHTELTRNIYDAATGQLLETDHSMDGSPWNILAEYEYDDLGRVKRQILGNYGEVRDYDYNIRGQVTGINGHYAETGEKQGESRTFGESLKYDYGFSQPRYDGKIAGMVWRSSDSKMRAYGYDYDKSGRLTAADYRQWEPSPGAVVGWSNIVHDRSVNGLSYDNNGNLLTMIQRDAKSIPVVPYGQSVPIDSLTYTYTANSNQLMAVRDSVSTDYGVGDFQDAPKTGDDYAYDADGNLTKDQNKGIREITYTYFNKPQTITFANGNIITYGYTAEGDKVEEFIKEGAANKRTDYVGNFVYQNDSVQYAGTSVGRTVWDNDTAKEDFFVKDHLGNVRSVVDVYHYPLQAYLATYEVASAQLENLFFDDVDGIRDDKPGSTDPSDTKAGRLNGADPDRRVGTSLLLKVMAGDKVQINVNSYYDGYDATQDQPVNGDEMLTSIVSTLTGGEGGLGESESHDPELVDRLFNPENYANAADLLQENADPSKPKAFLNYILFNEDMQVVGSFTGAFQATGDGAWTEIGMQEPLPIPENGYLAVYLSNATAIECDDCGGDGGIHPGDVFFDQVEVRFTRGNLKEENHYYPFGLPMGDIGSAAVGFTPNRRKYQTNEYIKGAGLNWMNFHARQFDPQIGRFMGVDPLAVSGGQDRLSPYAAMGNEPAGNIDPGGMEYEGVRTEPRFHPPDLNGGLLPSVAAFLGLPYYHDSYDYGAYFELSCDAFEEYCNMERIKSIIEDINRNMAEDMAGGVYVFGTEGGMIVNFSSMTGGTAPFSINLSTTAWYDGDGDGKPGLSGDGETKSTGDTYQKAKDANDGFSMFSTSFEFGTRGILYTKAGRSMGFTFGDVTLSEARMNAQLGEKVLGGAANALGIAAFGMQMGMDIWGLYNYYKFGANSLNAISPFHVGVDAAFGYIGLYGGWPGAAISTAYFFVSPALWFTPGQTIPLGPLPTFDNANYVYPYHP